MRITTSLAAISVATTFTAPATAQVVLDRVDPSRVESKNTNDGGHPALSPPPLEQEQSRAEPAGVSEQPITIGAITLSGLRVMHPSDFADIFEIYVGRTLSPGALAGLTDAIAARARARGYVLATAWIEPQPLAAGMLRVRVDEGSIDGIQLIGSQNSAVRNTLQPLLEHGPVMTRDLERRLLIAGDIDGVIIRRSRLVRKDARNILVVDLAADHARASFEIANDGSRPVGPVQAQANVRLSQILAADDQLSITALGTPLDAKEFGFGSVRYAKRISSSGTELGVSALYSVVNPGAYLENFNILGHSFQGVIDLLQPLLRRRSQSVWAQASFGVREVRQSRDGVRVRMDRLTVARIGLSGFSDVAGGRLRANATLSQGLGILGATRANDPLASRSDADGRFTSAAFWFDWTRPLGNQFSIRASGSSQLSSRPLLVSEEAGLGGGSFLRAYDYSERSGDQSAMGSLEFRYDVKSRVSAAAPQIYAFVDGGKVTNLQHGFGSGTLFSAGAGLRAAILPSLAASVEVAAPLSGARYDSGTRQAVFNFRLRQSF